MSKEFRYTRFGMVPSELTDAKMDMNEQIFKSYLASATKFDLMSDADIHTEVFSIATQYIGNSFRNWLYVNFRNGNGPRKELVRKIVGYIKGEISGQSVISQLKIDISRINYLKPGTPLSTPILFDEYNPEKDDFTVQDVNFKNIREDHLFEFFALIGPELTAKFCLSIDGVIYG